jgi:hypothetical protein
MGVEVHPDFTILNLATHETILWEHFGYLDDHDYREYQFLKKLNSYQENGYYIGENLIITMETQRNPLNIRQVRDLIEHYFGNRK